MNEKKGSDKKSELRKAPLSVEADEGLIRMLEATNKEFHGGKVSKADLLSWLVLHFEKSSFATAREDIQKRYFDKVTYLSSVVDELKKAKRDGRPGPDLESLLAPITGKKSSTNE